jgi:hypothetical protein
LELCMKKLGSVPGGANNFEKDGRGKKGAEKNKSGKERDISKYLVEGQGTMVKIKT